MARINDIRGGGKRDAAAHIGLDEMSARLEEIAEAFADAGIRADEALESRDSESDLTVAPPAPQPDLAVQPTPAPEAPNPQPAAPPPEAEATVLQGATGEVVQPADTRRRRTRDELAASALRQLRGFLHDEIVLPTRLDEDGAILKDDREREVAKAALAKLKLTELQDALAAKGLSRSGKKAELVERLGLYLEGDLSSVAHLVGNVERHPAAGRRHVGRIYPFDRLPELDKMAETLRAFTGGYVRTGLLRWFVIADVELELHPLRRLREGVVLSLKGSMRTYAVETTEDTVRSDPQSFPVTLNVVGDDATARVRSKDEDEARSAVEAFAYFVDELPRGPLALAAQQSPSWGATAGLTFQSLWLIGLLQTLLTREDMALRDVTSATFERSRKAGAIGPGDTHVSSARLRGQHVLDSQSACRHLQGGERLAGVTALISFDLGPDQRIELPVRIAVADTHVAVMTGYGKAGHDTALDLHERLEGFVADQMRDPQFDADRLEQTVQTMLARAVDLDPPVAADLFVRATGELVRLERD